MTYDFNQHLNQGIKSTSKPSKGVKAYFINAQDRKIIDVTDDLIRKEFHTKSFFTLTADGKGGVMTGGDMLTNDAIQLTADFLMCKPEDMGSRQEGPCIFTVNTENDLDLPYGFSFPGLPNLANGNGMVVIDEGFLEAGLEQFLKMKGPPKNEPDRLAMLKLAEFNPKDKIGFFRTQDLDGKVAIQPDLNCFAYLTIKGIGDNVQVKIVKHDTRKGDVWDADMREDLDPENGVDVTKEVQKFSKDMERRHGKSN